MSDDSQGLAHETRSGAIFRHTRAMLHASGCSLQTFSHRVVEQYHARVPEHLREVTFKTSGDLFRAAQTNAQHLSRWMNPDFEARMPVDMEEAWVAGLGEPYAKACRRDLARRYGLLDVPVMESGECDIAAVGTLTARFSDVLLSVAPTMADGKIDTADLDHLPAALQELDNLCAAAVALRNRIDKVRRASKRSR